MTVPSTKNVKTHVGNGVTTVFPFDFRIFAAEDLEVSLTLADGTIEEWVLGTDFTVPAKWEDVQAGGEIIATTAPASGTTLVIKRVLDLLQQTDLRNQGDFLAEVIEDQFDRFAMQDQQIAEVQGRTLQRPLSGGGWNALGYPIKNLGASVDPNDAVRKSELSAFATGVIQPLVDEAEDYRDQAGISAGQAAGSATTAGNAATTATDKLTEFQSQYYGAYASDPTEDPNGNPPGAGDLYFSTTAPVTSASGTQSIGTALNDRVLHVPDIAALRALTGVQDGQAVRMTTTGRAGDFYFSAADLSAEVAADPLSGIYVAPDIDPTGASGAFIRQFLGAVRPEWWAGFIPINDDYSQPIQYANDYLKASSSGGIIQLDGRRYTIGTTVNQSSGVIIQGTGINSTEIRAADGLNGDVIKSEGFDAITGTNQWLVSDGVLHGLGLRNLRINGNKANQTVGNGVSWYAKRVFVENVVIYDCFGTGFYSEAGDTIGQQGWEDLPEGVIGPLWLRNNGSRGMMFRGAHDSTLNYIVANENGAEGVRIEQSDGVYAGICDVGFMHIYANEGIGLYVGDGAPVRGGHIISESGFNEGIRILAAQTQIECLDLFNNCRTTGVAQGVIQAANETVISMLHVRDNGANVEAFRLSPNTRQCSINGGVINGTGTSGSRGFVVSNGCANNSIRISIFGFTQAGGIGLELNSGGQANNNHIVANIRNCETLFENGSGSANNILDLVLQTEAGQTAQSGAAEAASESWRVVGS